MFRGLGAIVYKETRHVMRDPKTLFLMLAIPGIELTIFGFAVNMDIQHIPTVVYNLDGREESRHLLDAFVNSSYFDIVGRVGSDEEMYRTIVRGGAKIAIKIPPDYSDNVLTGAQAQVQVLIDGSDSSSAMQALNVSNAIGLRASIEILGKLVGVDEGMPVDVRPRVLFNPDMRTTNFMVPGLVGIILQVVIMLLTTFAIVREKEQGTLEQLMVTPVSRLGLILGKLIPYAIIGIAETVSVILLMRLMFQVPIAGSLTLLAAFTMLFLICTLGLGLLISTFTDNQIQALQFAFLVILPSVLLSGFIFPQETMPTPIYICGQCVPVTYYIRILRGIILRNAGFAELWMEGAILGGMGVALLAMATLRFRKTLA